MGLFNSLFGKKQPEGRQLTQVHQLNVGDIISLTDSFALPSELRAQQFRVKAVNSYEFEHNTETEWVLEGNNNIEIYLGLSVDDTTELKFSFKITDDQVEALFDLDEFSEIFDEQPNAFLTCKALDGELSAWLSEQYQQHIFAKVGYFHRKDHRSENLSQYEGKDAGEPFELYVLYDQEQDKGIDVEVWQDGDTDIFLTLYRPLTDVVDMFPGS